MSRDRDILGQWNDPPNNVDDSNGVASSTAAPPCHAARLMTGAGGTAEPRNVSWPATAALAVTGGAPNADCTTNVGRSAAEWDRAGGTRRPRTRPKSCWHCASGS
jgi:hypothetical protein